MNTRELKEVLQLLFKNGSVLNENTSGRYHSERETLSSEVPLSQFGIILYAIYKEG